MKQGQLCLSLQWFLAISSAIQKIASNCACDAVVHSVPVTITGPYFVIKMTVLVFGNYFSEDYNYNCTYLAKLIPSNCSTSGFSKHAFPEVPFVEVPYQVPPWSPSPMLQECPNISPKKCTWYQPRRHVGTARFLLWSASWGVKRDRTRDSPSPLENCFENVLSTRWEGTLVALYRAMRLRFGYGFESCDANGPRNVKNTNLAKHRPIIFPPLLLVGSKESVLKVPKRGQFHAAIRVTRKCCDSCAQVALGTRTVSRRNFWDAESLAKRCGETCH